MRGFRTLATILSLSLVCWHLSAQTNNRIVKGRVQNEHGQVIEGVQIKADTGEQFTPKEDGNFEVRVPFQCRKLTFSAPFYIETSMEIDGSFLFVRLKYDKAAEEKARKDAEAKAKAEEDARAKAEKERLAAEEKLRKAAEAKAQAEQQAREKEQQKKETLEKEKDYNGRFSNKGLEHTLSLSYAYSFSTTQLTYRYSGIRTYGPLHPVELDYTLSYKINRLFSVGAGTGILFNLRSFTIRGDELVGESAALKERRLDIPMFLSLKFRPTRSAIRPYFEAQAGYYILSSCFTAGATIGVEYRLTKRSAIQCGALFKLIPYPNTSQYSPEPAAGLIIGLNL